MKLNKDETIIARRKTVLVLRSEQKVQAYCARCKNETIFVQPTYLGRHFGTDERALFRKVEAKTIGFIVNRSEQILVCVGCLSGQADAIRVASANRFTELKGRND